MSSGFICPECGGKTTVYNGRQSGDHFWRRRKCLKCGYRFTTKEKYMEDTKRFINKNWQEEWELK